MLIWVLNPLVELNIFEFNLKFIEKLKNKILGWLVMYENYLKDLTETFKIDFPN